MNEYFYVIGVVSLKPKDGSQSLLELAVIYKLRFVSKVQIFLDAKPYAMARG